MPSDEMAPSGSTAVLDAMTARAMEREQSAFRRETVMYMRWSTVLTAAVVVMLLWVAICLTMIAADMNAVWKP
jgi:ABC-type Fe3+-siderophore transport system permease subunit